MVVGRRRERVRRLGESVSSSLCEGRWFFGVVFAGEKIAEVDLL